MDLRAESLNIISLCSGGGGLDHGVELAIPCARSICLVEREAFACAQLVSAMEAGYLHKAAMWSDVTTFNGRPWRGLVDGVIGGIPCQPHSLAGKRLGEDDERDLWSAARKIIVQSGCWFVLIENVSGMLSSGGAERVKRDLQRLGFSVEGGLFTASEVGASHERERVFILAVANDALRRRHQSFAEGERHRSQRTHRGRGVGLADTSSAGLQGSERHGSHGERHRPTASGSVAELCGARLADSEGLTGRLHEGQRSEGCGETDFGWTSHDMVNAAGERRGEGRSQSEFRSGWDSASCTGCAGEQGLVDSVGSGRDGRKAVAVPRQVGRTADEWSGTAPLFPPGPGDLSGWRDLLDRAPELEPSFRRVADGLASRLDIARVDRLRLLGNGVVPLQAAYGLRTLAHRLAARGSVGATELVRLMAISFPHDNAPL